MPEMSGFEVVAAVGPTAHDRYAVRAFEVHALDYLLKPFDDRRLARAVARLDAAGDGLDARLAALLAERAPARPERLVIHDGGRALFVPLAEIDWIEAAGQYVVVHVLRESISTLEAELDPRSFARIRRSSIVRIERIHEVRSLLGGDYEVVLRDGASLTTSRGHRHRVQALLGRRVG
ncbi:two-component system, LytT family, response regulator [Nannocystis exedens]|uniref:Two-component system, LytT family, response regulator n=2 Tax=Nannocystis exedens TaxID=54 RepID=A0A1I1ZJX4_9BACT|nr:Sensory transduction protein LytR [Nannocystis exedens]SFE31975.1 two-component system, LytT family, response regulator [Nannocystis exedens]